MTKFIASCIRGFAFWGVILFVAVHLVGSWETLFKWTGAILYGFFLLLAKLFMLN